MLSHKKILRRFNELEKKYYYDKSFEISKNHLHSLIWNKNFFFPKFTLSGLLTNSILFILSIISIFLCKIKNISIANYFIVHKNKGGLYDFRSDYVLKEYDFQKSLNIIRCPSFIDSIKSYFIYPNVIFFLPFDYFNTPFFYKKKNLKNDYEILHQKEKKNFNQIRKIFQFLQIRKFVSIDDQRTIQVFLKVCSELNIESFGYMHYKFSKFIVGIKYLCFDNFLVWSDYFKKKLIEVNGKYRYKKILISGFHVKKLKNKTEKNKINILYVIDLNLNFKFTSNLLKKLNKEKKINFYIKLRPQVTETVWEQFCIKEGIRYFKFENLDKINQLIKIDYFIGNISTAILEALLYRAIPLKIISENDFADDLIKDKVVKKVRNFNDIVKITRNRPSKKLIDGLFHKVWGKKRYKSYAIKKFLNKYV